MITDFEDITKNYSDRELNYYAPLIRLGLKNKIGKANAIPTNAIIEGIFNLEMKNYPKTKRLRPERVRMIIRYINNTDSLENDNGEVLDIIGSSKGYYIAATTKDIEKSIESLEDRIKSLQTTLSAKKIHLHVYKHRENSNLLIQ